MIDIHTHILPRLDDGAKDSNTSIAMLNSLCEQGVQTVVFTPHYYGKRSTPDEFIRRRYAAYEHIKERIPAGLNVRLGAELHFTGINMPENDVLCQFAIEGTKYLLVEFPFTTAWTMELKERLFDFIRDTGYTPIIAHAERYTEVQKAPALLMEFVHMGCLVQVNAPAFLERREKKLAFALLKHGFVHCIGTDAHDMDVRAPKYAAAKAAVEKAGYAAAWKRAEDIMEKVIAGEQVVPEVGTAVKKFLGTYR